MKAQHDNLQPMAPVRPLEETRLYKVIRAARREVDASVRQAVAVEKKRKGQEVKGAPLEMKNVFAVCSSRQLWVVTESEVGSVFSALPTSFTDFTQMYANTPTLHFPLSALVSTPGCFCSKVTANLPTPWHFWKS